MATFVCVAPPFHGHLAPMSALAHALIRRGHRVSFAADIDGAGRLAVLGQTVDVVGLRTHTPGRIASVEARMAAVRGLTGLQPVIRDMAATTDMLADALPAVLERRCADALISDQLEPAGGLVAQALRLPHVSVASALPIGGGPAAPPFFTPWPPATSRWHRRRAGGARRVAAWMMGDLGAVIARHARRFGLGRLRMPEDCLSADLDLAQLPPDLDDPGAPCTPHALGPFRWPPVSARPSVGSQLARPLIFASLGTLFGGRIDLVRAILAVAHGLDAAAVIAHGGRLAAADLGPLPPHVTLTAWADQREILSRAALCISHAGMNTVLDAAAAGVPIVAVPIAFDQPGIAGRIERAGLGRRVTPGLGFRHRLQSAAAKVLTDAAFRRRAAEVASSMAQLNPLSTAVDTIERLVQPRTARVRLSGPGRRTEPA